MVKRLFTILSVGAMLFGLTACSSRSFDWEFQPQDAVGSWYVLEEASTAKIAFAADGSFRATDWPIELCDTKPPERPDLINWEKTLAFSGVWRLDTPARPYSGYLESTSGNCAIISFYFNRDGDDQQSLVFYLTTSEDDEDNVIIFDKG